MTGDESATGRRRLLTAVGGSILAVGLAGCSGGDDDGTTDGDDGGGEDTTTDDGSTATTATTEEATTTAESTTTTGDGGGESGSSGNLHLAASGDGHDWAAIAEREEASGFDVPDDAPTAFGYARSGSEMTVSYGSMTGSETVSSGTLYVLLLVDGSVENVVVWETPIESGDEFTVAPDAEVVQMDAGAVTTMVFAWEGPEGETYVVNKEDFEF